jgi:phospholipid transport system substrate-binding protein
MLVAWRMSPIAGAARRRTSCRLLDLAAAVGMAVAVALSAPPAIAETDSPSMFVQTLADQVTNMLKDAKLTANKRQAAFRQLLETKFDINLIGRFALEGSWFEATADQHREYLRLFGAYIVKSYGRWISAYATDRLIVVQSVEINDRDTLVQTKISRLPGAPQRVDWHVRASNDGLRVIDVIVKGVSMVNTQRSEFSAVIARKGIEGLLETLRAYMVQ